MMRDELDLPHLMQLPDGSLSNEEVGALISRIYAAERRLAACQLVSIEWAGKWEALHIAASACMHDNGWWDAEKQDALRAALEET